MNALVKATAPPALPAKVEPAWLAKQKPWAVQEAAAAWLAQRFGLKLGDKSWTDERGYRVHALRVWMRDPNAPASLLAKPLDLAGALNVLEQLMQPAPPAQIEAALAELSVQVKHFAGDGDRSDLQLAVYVRNLSQYPADIVLNELAMWPSVSKPVGEGRGYRNLAREWPEWFDLELRLKEAVAGRREMIEKLRREVEFAAAGDKRALT